MRKWYTIINTDNIEFYIGWNSYYFWKNEMIPYGHTWREWSTING